MINEYRKQIDIIDSEIISLLKKREILMNKIKEIKLEQNLPLKDKKREEQVLKKAGKFEKVFTEILK